MFDTFSYFASRNLHHSGIDRIFHAPMFFFNTTVRSLLSNSVYDVELNNSLWDMSLEFLERTDSEYLGMALLNCIH